LPAALVSLVMSSYQLNFPFGVNIAGVLLIEGRNLGAGVQLAGFVDINIE
jgi:hypothetical protein